MTNADRIRNMSDEELASWYVIKCEIMMGIKCQKPYKTCKDCILDWLQSEAEQERVRDNMTDLFYKPLTPDLRQQINDSIRNSVRELNTCQNNVYVNMQKTALNATKTLIDALPDGYPMPMYRR